MHRVPEGTTVSRRGTVLVSGELTHLPMLLGDLETLVIDEFPEEAETTWEKQREIVIQESANRAAVSGPALDRRFRCPDSTTTAQHTAKEVIQFTVAETTDDLVRISKKYSLKSGEKDKVGRFEMTGSGEIEFDRKEGVTKKSSMTYEVKVNESGVSITIPIDRDGAAVRARRSGRSSRRSKKRPPRPHRRPPPRPPGRNRSSPASGSSWSSN